MAVKYVLDACAMLAFVYKEPGYDIVLSALKQADENDVDVYINKLNLFEVYYDIRRSLGLKQAEDFYSMVLRLPIYIINGINDDVFREAGRIKIQYKMSLADSIVLAQASVMEASILTSDHHEFDVVEQNESIRFIWIR
jgi:predicted nucleic acid-binding protein